MNIVMNVIKVNDLDDYIDESIVPFAVCTPPYGVTSNRQKKYIEKYYDKIVDKRGWVSYYCNIVNADKCKQMEYKNIKFKDGKEEKIKGYSLEKNEKIKNKYTVISHFESGNKIDSLALVKLIRLDVEKVKKEVNNG